MPQIRFRDDDSPSRGALLVVAGALAGLAAGVLLAQRVGGLSALGARVRHRFQQAEDEMQQLAGYDYDSEGYDDLDDDLTPEEELEERVLEAFRNDPVLGERAVDIGGIGEGIIELTGWVHAASEMQLALTITRGVPGVNTVVNRLTVRSEEDELEEATDHYDASAGGGHWESMHGSSRRRRRSSSADADNLAEPKHSMENPSLIVDDAVRNAADDIEGLAERRKHEGTSAGQRGSGAAASPTGVPKADHVLDPLPKENPASGK